ncbi:hypothetical protein BH11ARM1_BH11ARM1_03100 [soil metagenome]
MRNLTAVLLVLALVQTVCAETLVTKAKIAEVSERGYVLEVGTEMIPVQDESATHFWKNRKAGARTDFVKGDSVTVRLKTDAAPTLVREMADTPTYDWLDHLRKDVTPCEVVKIDTKYLTVKLDGGGEFAYRYSDKSKLEVAGVKSVGELKEGQKLFIKGRLLPSLDTWIATIYDQKPAVATKSTGKKAPKIKPIKIGASGTLEGTVDVAKPPFSMIDMMVEGQLIHTTYTTKTTFTLDGAKIDASAVAHGLKISVTYKRDQFGRLIASKVVLTH